MKILLKSLSLATLVAFIVFSCDKTPKYQEPSLDISVNSDTVSKEGGLVTLQVQSNRSWNVSPSSQSGNDWFDISPMTGENNRNVAITLLPNSGVQRSVRLTVSVSSSLSKEITITQKGDGTVSAGGDGTETNPYSIAQGVAFFAASGSLPTNVWVKGYIVGGVKTTLTDNGNAIVSADDVVFGATGVRNTAVLIADSPDETDWRNVLIAELGLPTNGFPQGFRDAVNLVANPGNLGKELAVIGNFARYFAQPAVRSITDYKFEGGGTTPPGGTGTGTKEDPYNVERGRATQNSSTAWVKGYIVGSVRNGVSTISSANDVFIGVTSGFNSATNVLIADNPNETDYTKCIAVNLPTGSGGIRAAVNLMDNPENIGKTLAVRGVLRTYFGIAGLRDIVTSSTTDWVLDGEGTEPPAPAIFSETLLTQASFDKFTAVSVLGDQVWSFDSRYGALMSGYVSADLRSYANEDWFITPVIDLAGKSDVVLTFRHTRGPASAMSVPLSGFTLWISNNYTSGDPSTATWTELTIPTHATTGWGFVSSGDIDIPANMLTATTRIAWRYICNDTESATWQIQNVVVR